MGRSSFASVRVLAKTEFNHQQVTEANEVRLAKNDLLIMNELDSRNEVESSFFHISDRRIQALEVRNIYLLTGPNDSHHSIS